MNDDRSPAEARRRLAPRITDTDWLVLRRMRSAIGAAAQRLVRPGCDVIDFGCGAMPYAPLFAARGARYRGADLDGGEIAIGADGRLDAPSGSADLLVSFQVLEHIRDLDLYLGEARRVLRDDGRMILSTHGNWLFHPHPEDHRRWTAMGLRAEIEARGFDMLECTPLVGPLGWTTMLRLTCFATAARAVPLAGRTLAGMVAAAMNVRAMIEERITPAWVTADNACVYLTISRPRS